MGQTAVQEPIQYIVSEAGERTAVVLSWQAYEALQERSDSDAEQMDGLTNQELRALADGVLAPSNQSRLDELLTMNSGGVLTDALAQELDELLAKVDALNIVRARAIYTLQQRA